MSTEVINIPRDTTLNRLIEAVKGTPVLDGTVNTYKKEMRRWFLENGAADADSSELTALVDQWYQITRDEWNGYVEFYQPDVSAVTTGTKGGDNADLTCTPATDTDEGQDDYAGLPLFACVDCNFEVDSTTLEPVITAIEGINSSFSRTDPDKYVGVLQMSGWHYWQETGETYIHGYAALRSNIHAENVEPLAESVRVDGTIREWVVHAKYMAHLESSKLTSCAGLIPTAFLSHNTVHTYSKNNGSQYSGTCACEDAFLKIMAYIKYGSLTLDGILQGCVNNNYQYVAQVAEEGANRILISTSHNLEVGMSVLIGNYGSSTDRGSLYSISGNGGTVITKIETVTVDDVEYDAIYVDMDLVSGSDLNDDGTFDTAVNGSATSGTTYISTFHWRTGTTDKVLGNDGSPTSNTSGKYPAKLQGIEMMNGAYEIIADAILSLYLGDDEETYYYEPYTVKLSANQTTSISTNYEASGAQCEQPSSDGWNYIRKLSLSDGVMFPIDHDGGSSSTYTRDSIYQNASVTGAREWLARGALTLGVPNGGLSLVHGGLTLSGASWGCGARLSAAGNRGEFVA